MLTRCSGLRNSGLALRHCLSLRIGSLQQGCQLSTASSRSEEGVPLHTGRPRLVVLGTGWAAARLLRDINPNLYDLTVISLRNHMVFTPLLASATVGTLEPRSVAVHAHDIQKALFLPQNRLIIADAKCVRPDDKVVECESDGLTFKVHYDKLAICTGSLGSTFGIPGVHEHAHFLRDISHATRIRARLCENIALAGVPGRTPEDFQRLLHIVIVGGGPTGVEVAGELTDFIREDLRKLYPDRAHAMRLTLVEGKEVLGSFDEYLREYAVKKLMRSGVALRKGTVKAITATQLFLTDGAVLPYGLCIWSTGVGPTPFTLALPLARTRGGRIVVDGQMRVAAGAPAVPSVAAGAQAAAAGPSSGQPAAESATPPAPVPDVYALGDCCANTDTPLPALAQVAEQQGRYLAKVLNDEAKHKKEGKTAAPLPTPADFLYHPLGSMATLGGSSAILQGGSGKHQVRWGGFVSWLAWRSAYLTRLGSVSKRLSVAFNWTLTLIFGRDMSRW